MVRPFGNFPNVWSYIEKFPKSWTTWTSSSVCAETVGHGSRTLCRRTGRVVRGPPGGRARLRRIKLHDLRNTSVSLMLDQAIPVHIVAAWHGHDPAVSLSIYADAKADELRAAGASLFG